MSLSSGAGLGLWARVGLTLALAASGGALRARMSAEVDAEIARMSASPFALSSIPDELGDWRRDPAREKALDPSIARGTGATDQISRVYVDRRTGVALDVVVLYGPAQEMFIHSPENCYQAAGYGRAAGPATRTLPAASGSSDGEGRSFRTLVFTKGVGGTAETQEVYYAWRLRGRWALDLGVYKELRRVGGMHKVQVGRAAAPGELTGPDLPSGDSRHPPEDFLRLLADEMERLERAGRGSGGPGGAGRL